MVKHIISRKTIQQYVETQFRYTQRLPNLGLSKVDAVHELRLILKRLRAVATLLKSHNGFAKLNEELKNLSRALGPRRDHDIVEEWLAEHRKITPEHLLSTFRSLPLKPPAPSVLLIRKELLALKSKCTDLFHYRQHLDVDGDAAIQTGYRKIKIAARRAKRSKKPEDFHTFRKRMKTFQYRMESLELAEDKKIEKLLRKTKRLASLLGRDHDLLLVGKTFADLHHAELEPVCQKVLNQRNKLDRRALTKTSALLRDLP